MKIKPAIFIAIVTVSGFLSARTPVYGFNPDDRIENAFKKSSVFQAFLKNDAIKVVSKDGAVTLTGTVPHGFHISLCQDTAENLSGVISVDNRLTVTASQACPNAR